MNKFKPFTALVFDCYGTLIDWESGIWDAFQPLLMFNQAAFTRTDLLQQFSQAETALQSAQPDLIYPQLLTRVHKTVATTLLLETAPQLNEDFGNSVKFWPAFPDTADALRVLKKYFKLVILSNVDNAGFSSSNRKLGVEFDAIYSAQKVGSYKPDLANFEYMLHHIETDLAVKKDQILHTAQSLHHDHAPARQIGLANAWIDRQGLVDSENWGATAKVKQRPEYDFLFSSMAEMAEAVQQQQEK